MPVYIIQASCVSGKWEWYPIAGNIPLSVWEFVPKEGG
jgi:hypothetical protein